ncbi:MAG: hypothetical protein CTY33_00235 [Methylotenera sp.]|nr:MAG: hypothetical protein CTY33_00235 [Methylotenera sp.]
MARARNIKPAFFLNTDLSEIPALGRLAFIGLWTLADYKGCIECNFKKIKAQVLPYDECNIEELLNALEQFRFIRYYFVQGKRYIKIENFERHQNPHKNEREAGSDIPDITQKDNENNDLSQDGTKPDFIGTTRADSLNLIPDSPLLNPVDSAEKSSAPTTQNQAKGKALPKDWALPKAWGEWALSERPEFTALDVRKIAETFKDHWVANANQANAKKSDWEAAWRNWVRKQQASAKGFQTKGERIAANNDKAFQEFLNETNETIIEGEVVND